MPLPKHLQPLDRTGKHVVIGGQLIKLDDITRANVVNDGLGRGLVITRRGKPPVTYRGKSVDFVKGQLAKESITEVAR